MHTLKAKSLPRLRCAVAALLLLGAGAASLAAEAWPARPVTLVVPFPAGGTTDITGRAVALALSRQWKQAVVVDNKAGAGGTVGAAQVLRAPPDGYTLLVGTPAEQVNAPFLLARAPYDPARDFTPVGCISRGPNVLVVNPKLPVRTLGELIARAKSAPGTLNFGSAGNGNTSHLSGELLAQSAGIQLTHVPYRGNAPAITDTMGGQVQLLFSSPASVMPHIRSGALRPIAVTSNARIAALPETPTLREGGIPVDIYSWTCLFASAKVSAPLLDQLHAALARALDDPEVLRAIENAGAEKFSLSREAAQRFLAGERDTWGKLIRARNIRAD